MKKLLMIVLCALAVNALAEPQQLGDTTTTWELKEGVLTIGGIGDMPNGSGPWDNDRETITSVVVGEKVTSIGGDAFHECSVLMSVTIPMGVTNIGENAFQGCSGLTSVSIPEGVTEIGPGAFQGCSGLTSVSIPEGVTAIWRNTFCLCRSLTSVKIPSSVTTIGDRAFGECSSLASVTIPEGVTSIKTEAFYHCTALTSVAIPSSVTEIGQSAFYLCSSLASVTIPEGVTCIFPRAFQECSVLTSVTIPEGVMRLMDFAFADCSSLTSVTIPSSVTDIMDGVFFDCRSLTSVTIPASVTSIWEQAFFGCSGLDEVEFEGAPPAGFEQSSIGDDVFIWYNARYSDEWEKVLSDLGRKGAPYKPHSGRQSVVLPEVRTNTVNVIVTNIVVNYVFNSVQPKFAIPSSSDVGFVNIIAEVSGSCVAVPATWMVNYPNFVSKFGSDFTKALTMKTGKKDGTGKDMFVWQDYVAGTDPTDETDVFTASITIVDGKVKVSCSPELDDARKALRKYTTWGKKSLLDTNWMEVPEGREDEYNFFRVTVEMR